MKIRQIIAADATAFERKMQRADLALLSARHDVTTGASPAEGEIVHLYGADAPKGIRAGVATRLADRGFVSRFLSRGAEPLHDAIVTELPDPAYADALVAPAPPAPPYVLGSLTGGREGARALIHEAMARLSRFRDDVDWLLWDDPPSPDELSQVHLWVDPAVDDFDRDGFVVEALYARRPVLAARTPVNTQRLELLPASLVRPRDANELTHAVARNLFAAEPSLPDVEDLDERFSGTARLSALEELYARSRERG